MREGPRRYFHLYYCFYCLIPDERNICRGPSIETKICGDAVCHFIVVPGHCVPRKRGKPNTRGPHPEGHGVGAFYWVRLLFTPPNWPQINQQTLPVDAAGFAGRLGKCSAGFWQSFFFCRQISQDRGHKRAAPTWEDKSARLR